MVQRKKKMGGFNFFIKRRPNSRKLSPFKDYDGDGVLNAFDCAPRNFRKQGPLHNSQSGFDVDLDKEDIRDYSELSSKQRKEKARKILSKEYGTDNFKLKKKKGGYFVASFSNRDFD